MDPTAAAADDWWHSLPPDRRVQIWRWVDRPVAPAETPGQMSIPIRNTRRHRDRTHR